ncbi:MAG: alpha/beta hydrolase [Deltaproteobacteria bacterium]|nr:alpha/beta hydrolase [Deltaproteobacteria bacterium]
MADSRMSLLKSNDPGITSSLHIGDPDRYVVDAADGTSLVVRRWTRGTDSASPAAGPTIVLCDGLGCDGYVWPYLLARFVGERPLLHLQWRGHGESAVPADLQSVRIRVIVDDLSKVLDDFGIDDVVLLGHSMGVPVALECWRAFSEQRFSADILGLGLFCGVFEDPIKTWHGPHALDAAPTLGNLVMNLVFEQGTQGIIGRWQQLSGLWKRLVLSDFAYNTTVQGELNPAYISERDFRPYMEHLGRMDMRVFAQLARDMRAHSARDVLPTIDAPTLIVGGARDKFAPPWIAEEMHARIPGSDLLMMVEGSHCAPIEQPRLVERALLRLLKRID